MCEGRSVSDEGVRPSSVSDQVLGRTWVLTVVNMTPVKVMSPAEQTINRIGIAGLMNLVLILEACFSLQGMVTEEPTEYGGTVS